VPERIFFISELPKGATGKVHRRALKTMLRELSMNNKHNIVFYGWWVVLASAIGLFWGVPVTVYSFGVFFKPLMQEFHAGRAAISLGFTLHLLAAAVSAPLTGWLIDRCGSRNVILVGTSLFGSILLANRAFSGSLSQFYLFLVILGVALHGLGPIPYGNVISRWFDRRRGLALGLMMLGIGLGAIIVPSLAQLLIARFDWRSAYAVLGAAVLLIPIPIVAAVVKERPQAMGLLPDGLPFQAVVAGSEDGAEGLSARQAWGTRTFWLMVCAFFLAGASLQGCVIHLAAMLNDRGIDTQTAALGSSLVGVAILLGRVSTGYLLDRIFAPHIATVCFGGAALGIAMLWLGGPPVAFAGAFLVGLALGAEVDLIAYLTSRYFGLRAFGKVYSSIFAAFGLAAALGPLLMGVRFDRTGSYRGPLMAFFVAALVAAALMSRLGSYRFCARQPAEKPPTVSESIAEESLRA
jgi:MFS family permease